MSHKVIPVTKFLGTRLLSQRGPSSPNSPPNSCVIFLHGTGDSGHGIYNAVRDPINTIPESVVVYPTAPLRLSTMHGGCPIHVWHDRKDLSPASEEDALGIVDMGSKLAALVANINEEMNIPNSRIVVGGFSQGGHMALQLCYRFLPLSSPVAGVFALSSFLADESALYEDVRKRQSAAANPDNIPPPPPLFMGHGTDDQLVPYSWGSGTFKKLKKLNVDAEFHNFDVDHTVCHEELNLLKTWISEKLDA